MRLHNVHYYAADPYVRWITPSPQTILLGEGIRFDLLAAFNSDGSSDISGTYLHIRYKDSTFTPSLQMINHYFYLVQGASPESSAGNYTAVIDGNAYSGNNLL